MPTLLRVSGKPWTAVRRGFRQEDGVRRGSAGKKGKGRRGSAGYGEGRGCKQLLRMV